MNPNLYIQISETKKKKNPKANTRNEAMRSPQRKVISRRTHAWLVTVNESVKEIL